MAEEIDTQKPSREAVDPASNRYALRAKKQWSDSEYRSKIAAAAGKRKEGLLKKFNEDKEWVADFYVKFVQKNVKRCQLWWCIRSPKGRYYHFQNLSKWCRENEHLFDHENHIAKQPIAKAYAYGISNLKRAGGSHYGWTLVAQGQHEAQVMGHVHNTDYPHPKCD